MENENMDWCPVCEIVTTYIGEECATCGRLWGVDYSAADIEDRLRREKAERIADDLIDTYAAATDRPDDLQLVRGLLADAALAALIEKENAA